MYIDYNEIVKNFDIEGLTIRKVTNKFINENFDIKNIKFVVDKSSVDDSKIEIDESSMERIDIGSFLMGHEMKTSVWIGYIQSIISKDYIRTIKDQRGTYLVAYDKTEKNQPTLIELPEKKVRDGIKTALKEKIKIYKKKK